MSYYVVAVYYEDRAYGGPEEGGWWYSTGELVDVLTGHLDEGVAYEMARFYNDDEERARSGERARVVELGRRELKPELQANGCHMTDYDWEPKESDYVVRWDVPEYTPEHRPHYC